MINNRGLNDVEWLQYHEYLKNRIEADGPGSLKEARKSNKILMSDIFNISLHIMQYEDYIITKMDNYPKMSRYNYRKLLRNDFLSFNRDKKIDICLDL